MAITADVNKLIEGPKRKWSKEFLAKVEKVREERILKGSLVTIHEVGKRH